jgi:hypothetical protein
VEVPEPAAAGTAAAVTAFQPRLDVLPPAQLALWHELASLPKGFVLYGGTTPRSVFVTL